MSLIYLAGPMVFRPDANHVFTQIKEQCAAAGLMGLSPFDPPGWPDGLAGASLALAIKQANMDKIQRAQGVIACIDPFRGPGADNGTAWEMGYAQALGKPVVAWTAVPGDYLGRVGSVRDEQGWDVEDFGLADNLMLTAGISVFSDFAAAARHMAERLGQ